MASTDALPIPRKNTAYRVTFPILDADGDLTTGAAGLDSEISKDGGTFADCTNEATEIATSSGMYYLDLTSTEMNADCVAIIVKTSTTGAKTTPIVLYPLEDSDWRVNVVQWLGTAASTPTVAGVPNVNVKTWNDLATVALPLTPTTAGRTLDVTAANKVNGVVLVDTLTTYTGNTVQTGDAYARLGAPVGASISADIAGVQSDTDNLQTRIPAALDANGFMKADVEDWKGSTAPAMTGDAFARLGAPAGASVSADIAAVKSDTASTLSAVDTEVAAILAAVDTEVAAILAALTSNRGEPGQGAPGVSISAVAKIDYLYKAFRNKVTQTATTLSIYADDATTVDHKATVSDDATTYMRGELATGP